jgi:predicted nucleic acid-binding Zn ribbon protein
MKYICGFGAVAVVFCMACEQAPAPSIGTATATAAATASTVASAAPTATVKVTHKKRVFFLVPLDGAEVFGQTRVAIATEGVSVQKAFIIIDGEPVAAGQPVTAGDSVVALADGASSGEVKLSEGEHTLTIQLADAAGKSIGMSRTNKVRVSPDQGARSVSFAAPKDGAKVKSPVKLEFAVAGMKVVKAGERPIERVSGHHHIIVDGASIPVGQAVPADKTHVHYGKGQTKTELVLAKGKHTLTMQFADGAHVSYGSDMAATITIEVE